MPPLPHRVRRLVFQVRATSPEEALVLRKALRDHLGTALIAAMERAFDQAGWQAEIVHIPRLDVRVRISGAGGTRPGEQLDAAQDLGERHPVGGAGRHARHGVWDVEPGDDDLGARARAVARARPDARRQRPEPPAQRDGLRPDIAEDLAQRIEQELRRQLISIPSTAGPASSPAPFAGPAGPERAHRTATEPGSPWRDVTTGPVGRERVGLVGSPPGSPVTTGPVGRERAGLAGSPPGSDVGFSEPAPPTAVSIQQWEDAPAASLRVRLQMLLHYLETGSLSWPLANLDSAAVRSELVEAAGADLPGVLDRRTGAPASLRARVAFWFRWLQLLPDEKWPVAARAAAPPFGAWSARLPEIVAALSGAPAASLSRYARLQLGAAAIALVEHEPELADAAELASIVLHALGRTGAKRAGTIDATSGGTGAHDRAARHEDGTEGAEEERVRAASDLISRLPESAAAAFRGWITAARRAGAPESTADAQSGTAHGAASAPPGPDGPRRVDRASLPARSGLPEASAERAPQPVEPRVPRTEPILAAAPPDAREVPAFAAALRSMPFGQMVHYAGLVLVHPFLPRFFDSTSVKEVGTLALFPDELPRAAALLHLLATGEEEVFELDIDFIKILLGLSLDAQLPVSEGLLLASDREEVDALLTAVIGHWRALKNTSVNGLRTSFLQRHGLLREEDQGFRLQVEPAPFDMLLGQMPWGIGTIKLPWMKKAIFTDWPAP